MGELCKHEECIATRTVTGKLFDGKQLTMIDAAEDTPGAEPYGTRCSLNPRAYFQVQDPEAGDGKWFLVTVYQIKDVHTQLRLEVLLADVAAENAQPVEQEGEGT